MVTADDDDADDPLRKLTLHRSNNPPISESPKPLYLLGRALGAAPRRFLAMRREIGLHLPDGRGRFGLWNNHDGKLLDYSVLRQRRPDTHPNPAARRVELHLYHWELPLIELSIIFGMVLMWGLFCVIFPKSQDEPAPGADDTTGVGPGAGAGAGTGTGAL